MQQRAKINSKTIFSTIKSLDLIVEYIVPIKGETIIQNKEKNMENLWDMHNEKININVI